MIKKIFLIISLVSVLSVNVDAQEFKKTDFGVKTIVNLIDIEIQFYSPSTVRIIKSPEGMAFEKNSLSVIESPQKSSVIIKQSGNELIVSSEKIQVNLNLKNGKISFLTAGRKPMLNEKEGGVEFTDFNDAGNKTYSVYCFG